MSWHLRREEDRWEVWENGEKQEMRSLHFLSPRTTVPPFFSSFEELGKWLDTEEKKQAKNKALQLLTGRNYPTQVLRRKLCLKGFSDRIVQETVEWVLQLGYVNDSEYLRSAIRQQQERGHGRRAILWKLRLRGFSEEAIEKEMKEMMPLAVQKETLRKVIAKFRLSMEPSKRKKTVMALLRRGFDIETINEAIKIRPNREIGEME